MKVTDDVNYLEYFDKVLQTLDTVEEGTGFLAQMGPVLAGIFIIIFLFIIIIGSAALIIYALKKLPNLLIK